MADLYGAVEAGGTKFNCAIGTSAGDWVNEVRIKTTTPAETLEKVISFFKSSGEAIRSVGVGSFGPLDLDTRSSTYGHITSTPKPGWRDTDLVGPLQQGLDVPVALDTDVNASALGEYTWGAGQGLEVLLYLTIGTGIGGGVIISGAPLHGLVHPEMGHIQVPVQPDGFQGVCPFHVNCFEGMASGPALTARWAQTADTLPSDHPAWEIEAETIAAALHTFVLTLSPNRIILGGGVMQQAHLFPMIREKLFEQLSGYIRSEALSKSLDSYIVPPGLGNRSGLAGALVLAVEKARN